jgi:hypothetical protein
MYPHISKAMTFDGMPRWTPWHAHCYLDLQAALLCQHGWLHCWKTALLHYWTLESLMVIICTTRINIQRICILTTQCLYLLYADLRTNRDYCPIQCYLIGFRNWDGCLLRGTTWISLMHLRFLGIKRFFIIIIFIDCNWVDTRWQW